MPKRYKIIPFSLFIPGSSTQKINSVEYQSVIFYLVWTQLCNTNANSEFSFFALDLETCFTAITTSHQYVFNQS